MLHQLLHYRLSLTKPIGLLLEHAIAIWNHSTKLLHGQTPIEILFIGIKSTNPNFYFDVEFRSPCYVLDPAYKMEWIPKFTKLALECTMDCRINTLRPSIRIINLQTGNVSPQYHVIHDELFTSVHGNVSEELLTLQSGICSSNLTHRLITSTWMTSSMVILRWKDFTWGFLNDKQSRNTLLTDNLRGSGETWTHQNPMTNLIPLIFPTIKQ
jgi:hypothetical protein